MQEEIPAQRSPQQALLSTQEDDNGAASRANTIAQEAAATSETNSQDHQRTNHKARRNFVIGLVCLIVFGLEHYRIAK